MKRTPLYFLLLPVFMAGCATAPTRPVSENLTPDTSHSSAEVQRYMRMGEQAAGEGNVQVAAMLYHAAATSAPADPAPQLAMAQLYEGMGDEQSAANSYDALAKSSLLDSAGQLTVKLAAARAYLKAKNYDEAAQRYESLANSSGDWRAYNGLGVVRDLQNDEPVASRAYQTALEKAPADDRPKVRANLALSYILGNQPRRAIDLLEPLYRQGNLSSTEKRYLALAYGFMGRVEEAQKLGLAEPPSYDLLRQSLESADGPAVSAVPAGKVTRAPVE